jgi:general secretion pathway protein L
MKSLRSIVDGFSRWIDSIAATVAGLLDRFASPRSIRLVECESGEFHLQSNAPALALNRERIRISDGRIVGDTSKELADFLAGSRVDLVLRPEQFLIQPLELPSRATEFLDGIVRNQIDQLTPWSAGEVAFGWSKPVESGAERIVVTVAATALSVVTSYAEAIAALGARSIAVFTSAEQNGEAAVSIKVLERAPAIAFNTGRIRRALLTAFLGAGLAAAAAAVASTIIGASLEERQAELAGRIAKARMIAGAERNAAAGSATAILRTLGQRKHDSPSAVVVLDALSQILPDHTYVTELRLEEDRVQLTGFTRDAPSLIGLLEQSGRFTRASFFAPTTRVPSEPGERFHIEAHAQPLTPPHS